MQIPREVFDVSNILHTSLYSPILELDRSIQTLHQTLLDSVSPVASLLHTVFDSPGFKLLEKQLELDEETVKAFQKAGWAIAPSMPVSLLKRVVELHKGSKERFASQVIIGYYHRKAYANLKDMVSAWQTHPLFTSRMHIFLDALEAHINGQYTLSIPALMPQIEGILSELVNEHKLDASLGKIKQVYKAAIGDLGDVPWDTWAIANGLLYMLENNLYINSPFDKEIVKPPTQRKISRHTVLHGINTCYDKASVSLNTFLILDAISGLYYWMKTDTQLAESEAGL